MVSSMTGFSNGSAEVNGVSWTFEVKSVNGRGLDLRLYLPPGCEALEQEIRSRFKSAFSRGNMQASLQLKDRSDTGSVQIDSRLLTTLERRVRLADRRNGKRAGSLGQLMSLKGVLNSDKGNTSFSAEDAVGKAVLASVNEAIAQLHDARLREGDTLKTVLSRILAEMQAETVAAKQTGDTQPEQMKAKFRERANALLTDTKVSEERLEQEFAILINKADVTEEIDRLSAHIEEASRLLELGQPVGRKLDFLSQELLREANTLGSKSASLEMTRHSLALKSSIDQFKEQAANVE